VPEVDLAQALLPLERALLGLQQSLAQVLWATQESRACAQRIARSLEQEEADSAEVVEVQKFLNALPLSSEAALSTARTLQQQLSALRRLRSTLSHGG